MILKAECLDDNGKSGIRLVPRCKTFVPLRIPGISKKSILLIFQSNKSL